MKKSVYLIGLLLAIIFGCKSDFDETIETPTENGVINDSIRKIPVSNLPDGVKEAFDQVFINEKMSAKPGETNKQLPDFNFLENEVIVISKKGGITNYSVRVKQGEQITTFLKNNTIPSLTSKPKEGCNATGASGDQTSNHIGMISINVTNDGRRGDPTFVTHTNHGNFIESNFTNLNNGNNFNTWTPNPGSVGGVSGHSGGGGTLNGYNGYRYSGGFLRDAWGRIVSLKDQIHRYIRNIICGCFNNRPGDSTSLYVNMDNNPGDCRCYNGNYELNHDFSTLLPEEFFTLPKNHFKNKDCECLFEQQTKDLPDDVRLFEKITYLECSCQKNEVGGVALFLGLSPAEKAFLAQNLNFNAEICAFLNKDKSQAAKDFANEAVKAKMQGGEVDFPNTIINQLTGKAACVYDKLMNSSIGFKKMIQKFDGDFPVSHLKFSISYTLENGINGSTNNSKDFLIEIQLNGNTLNQRTVLGIARTIIHEVIHAELFRKLRSVNKNISINDFPGIYDYYIRHKGNWQHEQMASHYRKTIASILQEFDNYQSPLSFYEDFAWVGLHKTSSWNNLSNFEKTRITNLIVQYEANGNKNCN